MAGTLPAWMNTLQRPSGRGGLNMNASEKTRIVLDRLNRAGIAATFDQANSLRREELTLQRWSEAECGSSDSHASRAIERDDATGKPYMCVYPHSGGMRRYPVADREAGALRRVASICADLGINFYHQTDPRGCSLYVSQDALSDTNYTRGVPCCA